MFLLLVFENYQTTFNVQGLGYYDNKNNALEEKKNKK